MSVYKPAESPVYRYDFQYKRRRFHGSTGATNRRDAEKVEAGKREEAKALTKAHAAGSGALTIDLAAGRYWNEVGQHHVASKQTWKNLARLISFFGPDKQMVDVTDDDVTRLVAWRRGQRVKDRKKDKAGNPVPLIAAATVNRSTTEVLQKLFTRAKRSWGARFDREPDWRHHMLAEPQERVRELSGDEADRIDAAIREDYGPVFDFARASGQRLAECLLRWSEVNWTAGQIVKKGKGGRTIVVPITATVRQILWPLRGHHDEFVFTYTAKRTKGDRIKGQRYPVTYNGLKTTWKRVRKAAKVGDFRFHDFRHDLATKLLRETGNLKIVQKALNHSDVRTTTRYAHVMTDEVAAALASVQKSRKKSRSKLRRVG